MKREHWCPTCGKYWHTHYETEERLPYDLECLDCAWDRVVREAIPMVPIGGTDPD